MPISPRLRQPSPGTALREAPRLKGAEALHDAYGRRLAALSQFEVGAPLEPAFGVAEAEDSTCMIVLRHGTIVGTTSPWWCAWPPIRRWGRSTWRADDFRKSIVQVPSMAVIAGTTGNNNTTGTSTNDTIYGAASNDTLYGSGGDDPIYGG